MSTAWRIRDPIHGLIELNRTEIDLLDSPPLQRLRSIYQLAMAYLVYPGALHRRFDHSIGVTHVAGKICKALEINEDDTKIIRSTALLHDVGHGPFSHVSESVFKYVNEVELEKRAGKEEKIHELITEQIIHTCKDFEKVLSRNDRKAISRLLMGSWESELYKNIISGPLDADKQDYLLRDGFFCGVPYGVYDIDQLHHTFRKHRGDGVEMLVVDENGLQTLEQYILAKYYLKKTIYFHKVRRITDQMLIRALTSGVLIDNVDFLKRLYYYPLNGAEKEIFEYIHNYIEWHDQRIILELMKAEFQEFISYYFIKRLIMRRLFKRVFSRRMNEFSNKTKAMLPEEFNSKRNELEAHIAEVLNSKMSSMIKTHIKPYEVILNYFSIESVRTQSRDSESTILILKGNEIRSFEDESALFRSINEGMREESVECYVPISYGDEIEKKKILKKAEELIQPLIEKTFST